MTDIIIPVITGPTASGKSGLLQKLYEEGLDFEIVSADAFQVYRGLDIGTAKPSIDVLKRLPHHLIDILPPQGSYNAGDFVEQAEGVISDIQAKGKLAVVSGGTGLFIQSLIQGIFHAPEANETVRNQIRERINNQGQKKVFETLKDIDPEYAAKIHENDSVRIIRALEIYEVTGMPVSVAHKKFHRPPKFQYEIMVIDKERSVLYDDINERVKVMLKNGWLDEVKKLLQSGCTSEMASFKAIGYRELTDVLSGKLTINKAEELIAQKTRNYAKRQMTWFRGMDNVKFKKIEEIFDGIKKTC